MALAAPEIGTVFGRWTVVGGEVRDGKYNRIRRIPCRCECGAEHLVQLRNLLKGSSGGCLRCGIANRRPPTPAEDRIGKRFGRLVIRESLRGGYVEADCDCGGSARVLYGNLQSGMTKSCGCLGREQRISHGLSGHPLYRTWVGMIQRCTNENSKAWKYYGGRGVTMCSAWHESFDAFLADMGDKPSAKHSIDRIDNDRGYWCGKCKECVRLGRGANCRWATAKEQANNQRIASDSVLLTFNGETLTCSQWARRVGVSRQRIQQKIAAGYPIERILAPKQEQNARRFSFLGVSLTLGQWSKRLGIPYGLLQSRAQRGLTGERLFSLSKLEAVCRTCRQCGGTGHNARTCRNAEAA